ncbi:hypothetical protein YC2023_094404 [Brassica napus]
MTRYIQEETYIRIQEEMNCFESPILSPLGTPVLSPSSEPSNNDCATVIFSMFDCLSFLTVGSTDRSPTKSCCDGVKTVLEYNPNCLCIALESSRDMGFELINRKALAMPSICNIFINPRCDVASSPTASITTPGTTTKCLVHSWGVHIGGHVTNSCDVVLTPVPE